MKKGESKFFEIVGGCSKNLEELGKDKMEEKDVVETSGGGASTIVGCLSGCCSCSCEENDEKDVKTKEERREEFLVKEGYDKVNNDYYVKKHVSKYFKTKTKEFLFEDGCIWDDFPMKICRNYPFDSFKHCKHIKVKKNGNKVIPWLVIGTGEFDDGDTYEEVTSGICLECAIEAMNKIKENEK